jgi:ABC-2 type transport system ATP-binding protein
VDLPSGAVLEARALKKRYGRVRALEGLDLSVGRGEVYGFLGRNGAGKSTAIRVLMGITKLDDGEVRLFGQPARGGHVRLRERIGYVAQEQTFYGWMNARQLGRFVGGFFPTWSAEEFERRCRELELPPDRKVQGFSGGMRMKLALALALSHRPELLVLDEPTAGLDPVARREFLEIVRDDADRTGRTTFFSTHLIDEVELVADRVGIVDGGRTRYEGPVGELASRVRLARWPSPQPDAERAPAQAGERATPGWTDASALLASSELPPGIRVLSDRTFRGERRVVLESDHPSRWESLPLELEALPLEEIFIEMVRRAPPP